MSRNGNLKGQGRGTARRREVSENISKTPKGGRPRRYSKEILEKFRVVFTGRMSERGLIEKILMTRSCKIVNEAKKRGESWAAYYDDRHYAVMQKAGRIEDDTMRERTLRTIAEEKMKTAEALLAAGRIRAWEKLGYDPEVLEDGKRG